MAVSVRDFNPSIDTSAVVALEKLCETGPSGGISLFADLLGDPLGRVRHFPAYTMLVAEIDGEIVGMIRGGIKSMVCGRRRHCTSRRESPVIARAAYLLGLRVAPSKRRMGVALALARAVEAWSISQGAAVAYMATEKSNEPSLHLFTHRLGFRLARTPSLLVHPVYQHDEPTARGVAIASIDSVAATELYRSTLGACDFFPIDIDQVLSSKHCAGTWLATPSSEGGDLGALLSGGRGDPRKILGAAFSSWAVASVWRCDQIFKLCVGGAPWRVRALAAASRWIDATLPFLRLASFPDFFRPFGVDFVFGIHGEGERRAELVAALCKHARNVARRHSCAAIATELGADDPLAAAVPHWRSMSSSDDLWCVKELLGLRIGVDLEGGGCYDEGEDWLSAPLGSPIFVDPRDV